MNDTFWDVICGFRPLLKFSLSILAAFALMQLLLIAFAYDSSSLSIIIANFAIILVLFTISIYAIQRCGKIDE